MAYSTRGLYILNFSSFASHYWHYVGYVCSDGEASPSRFFCTSQHLSVCLCESFGYIHSWSVCFFCSIDLLMSNCWRFLLCRYFKHTMNKCYWRTMRLIKCAFELGSSNPNPILIDNWASCQSTSAWIGTTQVSFAFSLYIHFHLDNLGRSFYPSFSLVGCLTRE